MRWYRIALLALIALSSTSCDSGPPRDSAMQEGSVGVTQSDEAMAFVGGIAVHSGDVYASIKDELTGLESRYAMERNAIVERALEAQIDAEILKQEAQVKRKSIPQLVVDALGANGGMITEGMARGYYRERPELHSAPFEELRPAITAVLTVDRLAQARSQLVQDLRRSYDVQRQLPVFRLPIVSENEPRRGSEQPQIVITQFADFHCRYCAQQVPVLDRVLARYSDHVQMRFRFFAGTQVDITSDYTSRIAYCADKEGAFWRVHDAAFKAGGTLTRPEVRRIAAEASMDPEDLDQCARSGEVKEAIASDHAAGVQLGVQGTPTMFVNGRPLIGFVSEERLIGVLDAELAAMRQADFR
jgi:protein-disulfide isomerase